MPDALRLAFGTLTRLPVPAPRTVDRGTTAWAMSLAPVVGALLALVCGLPLLLDVQASASFLLAAVSIALLAFATRAIHLDGLADTADALGSGQPAAAALEIARKSDIGPFGVVALVLNLLLQVFALAACIDAGHGLSTLLVSVITARVALTWACTRLWPAARPDGLGAGVASSVPIGIPIIWAMAVLVSSYALLGAAGLVAVLLALLAGHVVLRITKHRFGGITGDVLGAVIECAMATALISLALLLPYWS